MNLKSAFRFSKPCYISRRGAESTEIERLSRLIGCVLFSPIRLGKRDFRDPSCHSFLHPDFGSFSASLHLCVGYSTAELMLKHSLSIRRGIIVLAAVFACTIGICLLYKFDPNANGFYPRCPFFLLTGLKCPGCGTTRAIHQVLHGNFREALHYNPFLGVAIPMTILFLVSPSHRRSVAWGRAFMCVTISWWLVRNLI